MKLKILLLISLLIIALSTKAQITTDGTLGPRLNLPGPDYQIKPNLGQQLGGNLFHSFQDFNLQSHESATFSGPDNVNNVISRVTGGNPSQIDGLLRSTIPNAEMYFLNPYGIMFGPNAKLDVQGGFHASTADYLRLGQDGRFDARQPNESLLTVAPVETFGFLTDNPAPISFQGSQLQVPPEKDISIVGGDIMMEQTTLFASGIYQMKGGQIKMASVASKGEVILQEYDLLVSSFNDLGDISISESANIEGETIYSTLSADGKQAGLILIKGENMLLSNLVHIHANTHGNPDKTDPRTGINIKLSGQLKLVQASEIQSKTFREGQAAPVIIESDRLELRDGSQISSNVWHAGQGNDITIKANEIVMSGATTIKFGSIDGIPARLASGIVSASYTSKADAIKSTINIETKRLVIEDLAQINVASLGAGNAGSINLKVEQLEIDNDGAIVSTAFNLGNGGSINIEANNIVLSNVGTINSSGFGTGKGKAGDITIKADNLELLNGGNITVSSLGLGESGTINIKVSDTLQIEGQADPNQSRFYEFVNEATGGLLPKAGVTPEDAAGPSKISASVINLGPESAGNIDIEAGQLSLRNGARITGEHRGPGDAGDISIRANDIRLTQGTITTETFGGGGGGNITVNTPNLLSLREGEITTSVGTGEGTGGNINIKKPVFLVLNQSQIKAQADKGRGGDIAIKSHQFLKSPNSLVSASSKLGIDGNIEIESPDIDMNAFIVVLPGAYMETQLPQSCQVQDLEELSRFRIAIEPDGMPRTPMSFPD